MGIAFVGNYAGQCHSEAGRVRVRDSTHDDIGTPIVCRGVFSCEDSLTRKSDFPQLQR